MWTDSNGQDWSTTVTVTTVRRVQELTGVLLTDAADSNLIDRLYSDVILLCNVLYAVSKNQASERGILAEQFGELLAGETIDKACDSLMTDIVYFFPNSRRPIVQRMREVATKLEAAKIGLMETKMSEDQLTKLIASQMEKASKEIDEYLAEHGKASGKLPESSALIRGQ